MSKPSSYQERQHIQPTMSNGTPAPVTPDGSIDMAAVVERMTDVARCCLCGGMLVTAPDAVFCSVCKREVAYNFSSQATIDRMWAEYDAKKRRLTGSA